MNIRKKRISEIVDLLLKNANVTEPAVPLDLIAQNLNLKLGYESFDDDLCGCLVRKNGVGLIAINQNHPEGRRRFTLAHEIGHFMLHSSEEGFIDKESSIFLRSNDSVRKAEPMEIEANYFAAELLMPERFIEDDLKNNSSPFNGNDLVQTMATRYNVSPQAMTTRLLALGYRIPA